MPYQTLLVEKAGSIVTVTLNRPDRLNAINDTMREEMKAFLESFARDESLRVMILTGQGRAFCTGADLEIFDASWTPADFREYLRRLTGFFDDLELVEKPVIAAINGPCVGGGVELSLSCDIRIAAQGARFGLPESNLGLIPSAGACSRLATFVGYGWAKYLILTGELIGASEAQTIGLVGRVVPDGNLMEEARAVAEKLSRKAPLAMGLAKRVLGSLANADLPAGRALEAIAQTVLLKTADHQEGMKAFREKRKPEFRGK